jgi:flagellar biosynthesis regulator FlbT
VDDFSRSTKFLNAVYKPSILDEVIQISDIINSEKQYHLLKLLLNHESLFDGTLREFYLVPVSLQLMDQGVKTVHTCPYTVPRAVEQQLRKELPDW